MFLLLIQITGFILGIIGIAAERILFYLQSREDFERKTDRVERY